ncbi:hypothetical protein QYF36_017120 [Acer negundo]|nr:hypothetical protein QYF36_017120 [Acer negundo]
MVRSNQEAIDTFFSITSANESVALQKLEGARKATENAIHICRVDEQVNKAVLGANGAATAARVAAIKVVQNRVDARLAKAYRRLRKRVCFEIFGSISIGIAGGKYTAQQMLRYPNLKSKSADLSGVQLAFMDNFACMTSYSITAR